MKGLLFVCGLLATTVSGHIQMVEPVPLRSPKSKDQSGKIDYSYTNPLSTDGSDYPCKGYANDPFKSVADYSPGQQYSLKLEGSATHNGGSCQVGLSYDKGKTFRVIHSMIGGCPLTKEYQFEIPQNAPSGEALLSWTWFNKVGNREMYMNCAQVTIGGGGGGGGGGQKPKDNNKAISRRDGFDSLPEIFQANVNGPGKCRTIEGKDVNFPMPGPSKEGNGEGKGYECEGSAPFLGGGGGGGGSPKGGDNNGASNGVNNNGGGSNNNNGGSGGSNGGSNGANNGAGANAGGQNNNGGNNNGGGNNNNGGGGNNNGGQSNKGPNSNTDKPNNSSNNHHGPSQPPKKPNPPAPGKPATDKPAPKVPKPFGDANKDSSTMRTDSTTDKDEATHAWMAKAKGCKPNTVICAPDGQTWALCDRGNPIHMGNVAAGTACKHGAMEHSPMQHAA